MPKKKTRTKSSTRRITVTNSVTRVFQKGRSRLQKKSKTEIIESLRADGSVVKVEKVIRLIGKPRIK